MKFESVAQVILFFSSAILGIFALIKLPEARNAKDKPLKFSVDLKKVFSALKKEFRKMNPFKGFSHEVFVQRVLTRIRIFSLKLEGKSSNILQEIRESASQRKARENDDYWEKVQKSTKSGK